MLLEGRCPAYIARAGTVLGQPTATGGQPRPLRCGGGGTPGALPIGRTLRCGRCGRRMTVAYWCPRAAWRYTCSRAMVDYAEPVCQGLPAESWMIWSPLRSLTLVLVEPAGAGAEPDGGGRPRARAGAAASGSPAGSSSGPAMRRSVLAGNTTRSSRESPRRGSWSGDGRSAEGAAPARRRNTPGSPGAAPGPIGRPRADPCLCGPAGPVERSDDDSRRPPADRPPVGPGGGRHGPRGERTGRRDHPLAGDSAATTSWCGRCSNTGRWPTTSGS